MRLTALSVILFFLTMNFLSQVLAIKNSTKADQRAATLPPCAACTVLIDSFKKGMERTDRNKFDGGDTDWEEKKMGSYKKSEIRLIEIQEKLCSEVDRGQSQCQLNMEMHESLLEEWWHQHQDEEADLHKWFCTERLKVCCLPNHYGPLCKPCRGGIDNVCNGNGKCKGAGTRKGNGECLCNAGYAGAVCDSCAKNFYEAYKDETKVLCEKCHKACNGPCSGAGPQSCFSCNEGWRMESGRGCLDFNECINPNPPCDGKNEFCVNNEGSYTCLKCDKSCEGCHGDGPDMCTKCADGFKLEKGICIDEETLEDENEIATELDENSTENGSMEESAAEKNGEEVQNENREEL